MGNKNDGDDEINGAVAIEVSTLKNVVSSAAEAELGGEFYNETRACAIRTTLTKMGHEQPPTPIVTDNMTASNLVNKKSNRDDHVRLI